VRTHPDANASRDRTTSHAIAQVLREQHRASLARCLPLRTREPLHQRDAEVAE
jgi:hypothetical protein